MSKTYAEKLKDPRWQRLRLEVMGQSGFRCEHCGDKTKNLQVHHPAYKKGADPWDYEKTELLCYCEECHAAATKAQEKFKAMSFASPRKFAELMEMISDGVLDAACECLIDLIVTHHKLKGDSIGVYYGGLKHAEQKMLKALTESGWFK